MAFPNLTTFKQRFRVKSSVDVALDKAQAIDERPNPTRTSRESSCDTPKLDNRDDKMSANTVPRSTLLSAMKARARAAMNKKAGTKASKECRTTAPSTPIKEPEVTSEEASTEFVDALAEESEGEEEELVLATRELIADVLVIKDSSRAAVDEQEPAEVQEEEAASVLATDLSPAAPSSSPSSSSSSLLTTTTVLLVLCVVVAMAVTRARK